MSKTDQCQCCPGCSFDKVAQTGGRDAPNECSPSRLSASPQSSHLVFREGPKRASGPQSRWHVADINRLKVCPKVARPLPPPPPLSRLLTARLKTPLSSPPCSFSRLQVFLNTYGIQTQTPQQAEPIQIWAQQELVKVSGFRSRLLCGGARACDSAQPRVTARFRGRAVHPEVLPIKARKPLYPTWLSVCVQCVHTLLIAALC